LLPHPTTPDPIRRLAIQDRWLFRQKARNASALAKVSAEAQRRIDNMLIDLDLFDVPKDHDANVARDEKAADYIAVKFLKSLTHNTRGDIRLITRTEAEYWRRKFSVEFVPVEQEPESMRVVIIQQCPDGQPGDVIDVPRDKAEVMVKAGVARLPSVKDLSRANSIAGRAKLKGGI
jgi:hypothetical protein